MLPMVSKAVGVSESPGSKTPPPTVTEPTIVPVPPNMPPFTLTAPSTVPDPVWLLINSAPSVIVVPPVYTLAAVSVRAPVPFLVREPKPRTIPVNVVLKLLLPFVRLLLPRNTNPSPSREPIVVLGSSL